MKLNAMLAHVPDLRSVSSEDDPDVTAGITEDSRTVKPGSIFVARAGTSFDGYTFVPSAIQNGAVAVVGERHPREVSCPIPYVHVDDSGLALAHLAASWEGFPSHHLIMIGVTGTDGKTTTCNLIFSILQAANIRAGMITTINAKLGDEEIETGLHVTTPTAPETQHYLRRMVDAGLTHCVLETTSHALIQSRVAACDFDIAVITNITHEHLDFHGSLDEYRGAKAILFTGLLQGYRKRGIAKTAIINEDDVTNADFLRHIPADRTIGYSSHSTTQCDVVATKVVHSPGQMKIAVKALGKPLTLRSELAGEFNVSNILAAVCSGLALDMNRSAIYDGVTMLRAIPGRMERIDEGQSFLVIVDFAHTPNALRSALQAARQMIEPSGRVIVIFGCAGLRDKEKRRLMGYEAAANADLTFITAEDPRTESLDVIMSATASAMTEKGGMEGTTFWRVADRGEAIHLAVGAAQHGDVVIACGKGHEQSMCFGEIEYPWDDRDAIRAALRGTALKTLPTAVAH